MSCTCMLLVNNKTSIRFQAQSNYFSFTSVVKDIVKLLQCSPGQVVSLAKKTDLVFVRRQKNRTASVCYMCCALFPMINRCRVLFSQDLSLGVGRPSK